MTIAESNDILHLGSHHHGKQHIDESGVARLNREAGKEPARSRHCVSERICRRRHWGNLGRRRGAMNWSQENCLIDDHRLTCERRGGDLRLAPNRSASLRHRFGCGFMRFDAAHGKARIFCSLFSHLQEEAAFLLRTIQGAKPHLFAQTADVCAAVLQLPRAPQEMLPTKRELRRKALIFNGVKT